jgi:hypothetical protein
VTGFARLTDFAPLLCCLLLWVRKRDLDSLINDEVHELIETLPPVSDTVARYTANSSYPELSLDPHAQVLVEPYGDGCSRLQQLKDEIDRREEDCGVISVATTRCTREVVVPYLFHRHGLGLVSSCRKQCDAIHVPPRPVIFD